MEETERFKLLGSVFRQLPGEFNGLTVHPLTAGRWDLLRERGNKFLFQEEGEEVVPPQRGDYESDQEFREASNAFRESQRDLDEGMMFAICEFLWVHTAPVAEVLLADEDERVWKRSVKAFGIERADITAVIDYMMTFKDKAQELAASMVDPVEDDEERQGSPGKTLTSLTGSQATSILSADTAPPSEGIICSGSSPLPRDCNTPTAPTGNPGSASSGVGTPPGGDPVAVMPSPMPVVASPPSGSGG